MSNLKPPWLTILKKLYIQIQVFKLPVVFCPINKKCLHINLSFHFLTQGRLPLIFLTMNIKKPYTEIPVFHRLRARNPGCEHLSFIFSFKKRTKFLSSLLGFFNIIIKINLFSIILLKIPKICKLCYNKYIKDNDGGQKWKQSILTLIQTATESSLRFVRTNPKIKVAEIRYLSFF